jgi:hypothetical protein
MPAEPHPLAPMLDEARALLGERGAMKSEANVALCRLIVRILETMVHGKALTRIPQKHEHPEDDEPAPQPSAPRRI